MTAEVTDSDPGTGTEETPTPQASIQDDKQDSTFDVEALTATLKTYIDESVKVSTQSVKDKRIQRLTNQVGDFESQLTRYEELQSEGLSKSDAKFRMNVEDFISKQQAEVPPEETAGTLSTPEVSVDTQAILEGLGLEANTPEVATILRDVEDPAERIVEFANLATKAKTQQTAPNPAAVQPSGGGQSTTQDADAIADRLSELQKEPTRNWEEIQRLGGELDKLIPKQDVR